MRPFRGPGPRVAVAALLLLAIDAPGVSAGTVTYGYDAQGRVISAAYSDGTAIAYAYDAAGNRATQSVCTFWGASSGALVWGASSWCSQSWWSPGALNATAAVIENSSNNIMPLRPTGGTATSVTVSGTASHGTATASGTTITYTPVSGYVGADSFQYTVTNVAGTSSAATVSINVSAP
jgi:large repetitive protein